ncbi:hypothetical protein B0H10DRAFT_1957428 [Mycena sp. CBHHK59/15]|nr:hypothetical protein B0H10DRAFT_1957428 [Mycena sp. CBHHK59/15]
MCVIICCIPINTTTSILIIIVQWFIGGRISCKEYEPGDLEHTQQEGDSLWDQGWQDLAHEVRSSSFRKDLGVEFQSLFTENCKASVPSGRVELKFPVVRVNLVGLEVILLEYNTKIAHLIFHPMILRGQLSLHAIPKDHEFLHLSAYQLTIEKQIDALEKLYGA